MLNVKGAIEYVNGTAAELLGPATLPLPPSTSIMRLLKLVTHRSRQEVGLPLDEVILNGKRAGYRNCIRRDGAGDPSRGGSSRSRTATSRTWCAASC